MAVGLEPGTVLDLVPRPVDEDRAGVLVHLHDGAGGQQDVLAEDRRTGVDDQEGGSHLLREPVDLADPAVGGFDVVADEIGAGHVPGRRAPSAGRHARAPGADRPVVRWVCGGSPFSRGGGVVDVDGDRSGRVAVLLVRQDHVHRAARAGRQSGVQGMGGVLGADAVVDHRGDGGRCHRVEGFDLDGREREREGAGALGRGLCCQQAQGGHRQVFER
ncbi:hypothetical protein [Kitasatospora sp. NPDC085879]|uniref:hypothetical protein n=1 Tax=Kitasatospora sp. NPDC085879 TaxID=3154769 RepID=UPI003440C911